MKKFVPVIFLLILSGCAARQSNLFWRVKDFVLEKSPAVELYKPDNQIAMSVPTVAMQQMMLAHLRITRSAGVQSELYLCDGDTPNAFAGVIKTGQRVIAINLGMMKLIDGEANEYAALIGHEAAHWVKGHMDSGQTRTNTLNAIGTLAGVGLAAAGVPAAGIITGLSVDLIDSSYSRDQEREADALSIEYMLANNYDPRAAITLHQKFLKIDRGLHLPFLSSHPSGEERIQNLKLLIDAKAREQ